MQATFQRRQTPLSPDVPFALTAPFLEDPAKRAQWAAFVRKARPLRDLGDLAHVGERLRGFLVAPFRATRGEYPPGRAQRARLPADAVGRSGRVAAVKPAAGELPQAPTVQAGMPGTPALRDQAPIMRGWVSRPPS